MTTVYMSFKRHACCLLQSHHPTTTTNHVWISDELLDSLYQRFSLSRIPKRCGSSVPGPLEAQRRAAKRRMMGLAKLEGGEGGPIHPAFLAGLGSGRELYGWKWQAPITSPQMPETKQKEGNGFPRPHVRRCRGR